MIMTTIVYDDDGDNDDDGDDIAMSKRMMDGSRL